MKLRGRQEIQDLPEGSGESYQATSELSEF